MTKFIKYGISLKYSLFWRTVYIMKMKPSQSISGLLASSLAAASLASMLAVPLGVTAAVAVVGLAAPASAEARPRGGRYAVSRGTNPNAPRRWMSAGKAVKFCSRGPCGTSEYMQTRNGSWRPGPIRGGKVVNSYGGRVRILY